MLKNKIFNYYSAADFAVMIVPMLLQKLQLTETDLKTCIRTSLSQLSTRPITFTELKTGYFTCCFEFSRRRMGRVDSCERLVLMHVFRSVSVSCSFCKRIGTIIDLFRVCGDGVDVDDDDSISSTTDAVVEYVKSDQVTSSFTNFIEIKSRII